MLMAFLEHRPAREVDSLALAVKPSPDPEMNYFSAAHLAYCGHTAVAIEMLKRAIAGGYCSYPAIDSDPLLPIAEKRIIRPWPPRALDRGFDAEDSFGSS